MLVINEAVDSRCGHPISAHCSCAGHANQAARDGQYRGEYSGNPREEAIENVVKPSPLPVPAWNFDTTPKKANDVVENAAMSQVYQESGMYAGAGAGQQVRNVQRADNKPSPLPVQAWKF